MTINAVDISMNLGVGGVLVHPSSIYDSFGGSGALDSGKWTLYEGNNASSQLTVTQASGRYNGAIVSQSGINTRWANSDEGSMYYVALTGDFDVVATRIGLENGAGSSSLQFCGLILWNALNTYEFAIPGNRNGTLNTIEYKTVISGTMNVDDLGANAVTNHRCDLRVARVGSTVTWYYRAANSSDSWTSVDMDSLAGNRVSFGSTVRLGIITYGSDGCPDFNGTCDQIEITGGGL